jgi:hypothetical protein
VGQSGYPPTKEAGDAQNSTKDNRLYPVSPLDDAAEATDDLDTAAQPHDMAVCWPAAPSDHQRSSS